MMLLSNLAVMLLVIAPLAASAMQSMCNVTYRIYDTELESYYVDLYGEDNISYPPCKINIEAVVKCPSPFEGVVQLQLRKSDGSLVKTKSERVVPYFLYGDIKGKIRSSPVLQGEYVIQSMLDGVVTEPFRFTLYPCVPTHK